MSPCSKVYSLRMLNARILFFDGERAHGESWMVQFFLLCGDIYFFIHFILGLHSALANDEGTVNGLY